MQIANRRVGKAVSQPLRVNMLEKFAKKALENQLGTLVMPLSESEKAVSTEAACMRMQ